MAPAVILSGAPFTQARLAFQEKDAEHAEITKHVENILPFACSVISACSAFSFLL
jgi:hypothetical protein